MSTAQQERELYDLGMIMVLGRKESFPSPEWLRQEIAKYLERGSVYAKGKCAVSTPHLTIAGHHGPCIREAGHRGCHVVTFGSGVSVSYFSPVYVETEITWVLDEDLQELEGP
jgi:hypothetical protein